MMKNEVNKNYFKQQYWKKIIGEAYSRSRYREENDDTSVKIEKEKYNSVRSFREQNATPVRNCDSTTITISRNTTISRKKNFAI